MCILDDCLSHVLWGEEDCRGSPWRYYPQDVVFYKAPGGQAGDDPPDFVFFRQRARLQEGRDAIGDGVVPLMDSDVLKTIFLRY